MKRTLQTLILVALVCTSLQAEAENVVVKMKELGHTAFHGIITGSKKLNAAATAQEGAEGSAAPYTVFVPNNTAVSAQKDTDKEKLKDMVQLLVVPGEKMMELEDDTYAPILSGYMLSINKGKKTLATYDSDAEKEIDTVHIVDGPHKTGNGAVYVIDRMLEPKSALPAA